MEKQFLEECLAKGMSLEAIGREVGKHPSTVGYWFKKHGLNAAGRNRFSPRGGLERGFLETAVTDGLTLEEMAERVDRDISTVRYWLRRYGLKATGGSRRREAREAKQRGERYIERSCPRHGQTRFALENRGSYRCMKCRRADVSAWRRKAKLRLVQEAGGGCRLCGYDRYLGALQFHHLDPSLKSFSLSRRGCTRAFGELQAEAAKCVLLCANCHAEVENGVATINADHQIEAPPGGFEPPRTD
jgi:transposase